MTQKVASRVVSLLLVFAMLLSAAPFSAFATENDATDVTVAATEETTPEATEEATEEETEPQVGLLAETTPDTGVVNDGKKFGYKGYYNVISKKDYVLVPGAAYESEIVLNNAAGTRRQVLHIIEVDPSNPDVSIVPGYYQIDQLAQAPKNEANWAHQELTEMAKYYENNLGYNIVGGMNTDLYYDTYAPRILVYNGQSIGVKGEYSPSSSILYVFKDAEGKVSCDVKAYKKADFDKYMAEGILLHAVSVSFSMVVQNGELVSKTENRTAAAAARSMVGVKEDGTLVICMNDGRGANNSVGLSDWEEGEVMLALGCKWAANCDGGGSSTFLTKRAGEENFTMRSVPCDGAQRPTAHGIFVASNVGPTGVLDVVNVESGYDIFALNTVYTFGAEAIDTHGYAMELPADASWALSDASFGTIENGTFVSNGTKGTVDVQVISGGKVVGSKTITVADPEVFKLSATSTTVPYTTADKVRTITLPIVAMTGEANVYVDTNAVSATLSNEAAGVLNGFQFTATDDTSIAGVDVTITYGEIVLTYSIAFGKGSEIIFDFEDGTRSNFVGYAEAKQWSKDNNIANGLFDSPYPHGGQMDPFTVATTHMSSAANGEPVRNGNHALVWKFDNTDPDFEAWSYYYLYNIGEPLVLRDVENGKLATSLGMWVYIPEDAFPSSNGKGFSLQAILWGRNAEGALITLSQHYMFTSAATGNRISLNNATNADIPESRWVYASVDLTGYDYVSMPVATSGHSWSPAFLRSYVKPKFANKVTFYIDDITLDYSSAVDDRVLPTITAPTYSTSDTAVSLENGTVVNGNKVAFSATVADNAALDRTSGKIIVDGVEVKAAIVGGVLSSKEDVALGAGTHTVSFEVKDELGNPARLTRTFTIAGDAVVELSGHNDSGETPKAQSVYYVDINVENLADVEKLVAQLKLQTANTWETKGTVVADGFVVTFSYNEITELLTVTVEAVGGAVAEAGTIVSIPVRLWTYDRYDYLTESFVAAVSKNKPAVNIDCEVVYGTINGTPFGGEINVATELTTISSPYHVHDAELTVLNKEATTSEPGYENRTYCETCKSVVDWGTIIPKIVITHNYQIVDAKFVCQDEGCGKVYESGTGVFEMNGDLYYSINDELKTGWQTADEGYCYAGSDYKLYIGEKSVGGITYVFDENGSTKGAWTTNSTGTRYSYGPKYYSRMWVEIDGKTYYFGRNSYMYTGIRFVKDNPDTPAYWYDFGEDGAADKNETVADGLYEINGYHYVVVDGKTGSGIHEVDGAYYYGGLGSGFETAGYIAKNTTLSVNSTKANGLIPSGTYTFGADGKMIINHGPVGQYFYDENGFMVHAYQLVEFEGDYYFINDGHKYAVNRTIYLSSKHLAGTPFKAGYFEFGADGKMILPSGAMDDGYFYIKGVKQLAYQFIEFEGDYYFISDYNKYVVNKKVYLSSKHTEGTPFKPGYFEFGADGKMILPNGAMDDGYFYIDGVKQLAYQFIEFEGDYYFISDYNKYVVNKKVYLSAKHLEGTPFKPGYFEFGADGKMILKNGAMDDGYFYINGEKQLAYQLIEFEGDYYFISDYNKYVVNKRVYLSSKHTNGTGLKPGYYTFGADGKLIIE